MKHARPDYERIQDPAGLIPDDEPVFLIRGKDVVAPAIVEIWADSAELEGAAPNIVSAARAHATRMREYQKQNGAKVPDMPSE